MAPTKQLGQILLELGLISHDQLDEAIRYQYKTGHKLGTCLIALGFVQETDIVEALTSKTEIKSLVIGDMEVPAAVRSLIPAKKALKWEIMPLSVKIENGRKYLVLGMTDPTRQDIIREVQFLTNHTVIPYFVGLEDLQTAYERIYKERLQVISNPTSMQSIPEIELNQPIEPMEIINPSSTGSYRTLRRRPSGPPLGRIPESDTGDDVTTRDFETLLSRLDRIEQKLDDLASHLMGTSQRV